MVNAFYNKQIGNGGRHGSPPSPGQKGTPAAAPAPEKPAHPKAKLPGKSGPDRAAGVRRAKVAPKSIGL